MSLQDFEYKIKTETKTVEVTTTRRYFICKYCGFELDSIGMGRNINDRRMERHLKQCPQKPNIF